MNVKRLVLMILVLFQVEVWAQPSKSSTSVFSQNTNKTKLPAQPTETPKEKKVSLTLVTALSGSSFGNENGENSKFAAVKFAPILNYTLNETLDFKIHSKMYLVSGQSLTRFGEGAPQNGFFLHEALVNYKPLNFVSFHAGAINQEFLSAPLLLDDKAFPGVMEKVFLKNQNYEVAFIAEQTIPTSTSLSTKTVDKEESPTLLTETLKGSLQAFKGLKLELQGTLFHFNSLPSQVAFDSAVYGNSTPLMLGPNTANFKYDFNGWLVGAKTEISLQESLKIALGGYMLSNSQAPDAFNHGQSAYIEPSLDLSSNVTFSSRATTFFNESDSSPAYYNSFLLGHNNRQGFSVDGKLKFKKEGFDISSMYVDSDLINQSLNQSRQQFLMIKLEAQYDVL